jgi:hypothetical protein
MDAMRCMAAVLSSAPSKPKPCGYWTRERCAVDAQRFSSRNLWSRGSRGAFQSAWRNGWRRCKYIEHINHGDDEEREDYGSRW